MDRQTAIRKLRACLRLSKSSEAHEAAAALRHAQALMEQYGLTERDADAHAFSGFAAGTRYGRQGVPEHIGRLARTVAGAFGCHPILQEGARIWTTKMEILFVGPASAAQICEYAFTVLRRQLERQMQHHTRRIRKRTAKVARGASFALGWVIAVEQKLGTRELPSETMDGIKHWLKLRGMQTEAAECRDLAGESFKERDVLAGFVAGGKAALHGGLEGTRQHLLEKS